MEVQQIKNSITSCIEKYYSDKNVMFHKWDESDFHLFLIDYFEVLRKGIVPRKRCVHISRELKSKIKSSQFKLWRNRFDEIKSMFENGDDLNSFLSKKAKVSGFKDRLLTCWDMHHLHFYPEKKKGDMLLFVIVKDDAVYMVDVIPHSKRFVFSTFELINIVFRNWEFLLAPYRCKGVIDLSHVIKTDEEVNQFRGNGICTSIKIQNNIYHLDMMSSDGHNALDVMYANNILNNLRICERNGTFDRMEFIDLVSTEKMRPSFVLTYRDINNVRNVWCI